MDRADVERLRKELEAQSRRRQRRQYPAELRREAVRYARLRRQQGAVRREIAAELGLKFKTLCNWLDGQRGFRSVEIIDEPGPGPARGMRTLIVTTPRGMRIEGLDLDELAALIARVG